MKRSISNDNISEIDNNNNNKKNKVIDSTITEDFSLYFFHFYAGITPNMYVVPNSQITEEIRKWSDNTFNTSRDDEDRLEKDDLFGYNYILALTCAEYVYDEGEFVLEKCRKKILKCNGTEFNSEQSKLLSDNLGKWLTYKRPLAPVSMNTGKVYMYFGV